MEDKIVVGKTFLSDMPITVGLNEFGKFIVQYPNGTCCLLNSEDKVNVIRLLDINFQEFKKAVDEIVNAFLDERPHMDFVEEFPYHQIVTEALNSGRDYWVELAFNWLHSLGLENFLDDILAVVNNKNISQKVRHRIVKSVPHRSSERPDENEKEKK